MARVTIKKESCKSCQYCITACPKNVLAVGNEVNAKGYPYVYMANPDNCIGCTMCALICPDAAIEVYK